MTLLSALALAMGAVTFLLLLFLPVYQGVSVSISEGQQHEVRTSASLIAVNGYRVIFPLLVPPLLAVGAFLASRAIASRPLDNQPQLPSGIVVLGIDEWLRRLEVAA